MTMKKILIILIFISYNAIGQKAFDTSDSLINKTQYEKTSFSVMSLGISQGGKDEERFLFTGFSYMPLPEKRQDNDILFFIDTGEWFRSVGGEWKEIIKK